MLKKENLTFFCIILFLLLDSSTGQKEGLQCPTWYQPMYANSSSGTSFSCKCGSDLGKVVLCDHDGRVYLSTLHCMTYDPSSDLTMEGYCPFDNSKDINSAYIQLPQNISELNEFTCGWLNRTGPLCSTCQESLGVSVLSYEYKCVKCLGNLHGWLLYLTLALVPLTIFFFVVIYCNLDATAAPMNALLCIMQILIYSLNTNPGSILQVRNAVSKSLVIGAWTIVGVWNLDFFRYIYPSFCISQDLTMLQVISMEYIVSFYPLVLLQLTYTAIKLNDNNYRIIRKPWHVLKRCLIYIKKHSGMNLIPEISIIKCFSTFLLLAYTKILFVNFNLLGLTKIFKSDGELYHNEYNVLYNASIRYLSSEHLPYFILALFNFMTFNAIPLLILLLYPMKVFQKMLNCCNCFMWHPLHTFADKFQGCYKNGTEKSRDYRYFSGLYLLVRILYHLRAGWNTKYSIFLSQLVPFVFAVLFGVFHPYKNDFYNRLDCGLFALLTLGQICLATNKYIIDIPISFLYVLSVLPIMFMILIVIYKCLVKCAPKFTRKLKKIITRKLLKHHLYFASRSEDITCNEYLPIVSQTHGSYYNSVQS